MTQNEFCQHIREIHELKVAQKHECAECIKTNSEWVHLRTCQTCGVTLCCDDSPNRHMTGHYHQTHHPVVSSAEPGERWLWCYEDDAFVEY
ncbi:UBP-type zinc finger domain-containing protein [Chitinophaga defluvii]|uniref:UBP-type zinc finger domain-containing protein n=1 Tax=Chitinophaga defluvii TaxID=3163343 RepID=A0ABV2TBY0_9BACT